jgi:malate synthase
VNRVALEKVREDKVRANDGFDGTWVAHPDLVEVATVCFDAVLGQRPNQLGRLRDDVAVQGSQLVDVRIPGSSITEAGLRLNVNVGIQFRAPIRCGAVIPSPASTWVATT